MLWRVEYAVACVVVSVLLSGCAKQQLSATSSTSSLNQVVNSLGATLGRSEEDARRSREEAIIAQAIAAHEMRHP